MTETLTIQTKATTHIDAFELARYLSAKIGKSVQIIESPNDTNYVAKVKKGEIEDYDQEYVEDFLDAGYISMDMGYEVVLCYAANQGWIEEGDYVIRVSW